MSDTPYTNRRTYSFTDEDGIHCEAIHAEFARKLERERDEARADCERLNQLLRNETALGQGEIDHWAALEAERDEARAERDEWIARFRADEQLIKEAMEKHE